MKKGITKKSNESIGMSRKAYRSGKKPLGDISNLDPKRNNNKKKQPTGLKVSVVAEEDEQIGDEWFLHDHQKCIDCLSVSPQEIKEQYKYFLNWPPSSSHVEPEEMPYCDWLLEEKDHWMITPDQRIADSERMVMELSLELESEIADRRRMKLEAERADLEDQSPWKDEELNWSPVNFMLKEDLSP